MAGHEEVFQAEETGTRCNLKLEDRNADKDSVQREHATSACQTRLNFLFGETNKHCIPGFSV